MDSLLIQLAQIGQDAAGDVESQIWIGMEQRLEAIGGHFQHSGLGQRAHRGQARAIIDDGHLTKRLARPQRAQYPVLAVFRTAQDDDAAAVDDVESLLPLTLMDQRCIWRIGFLVGDPLEDGNHVGIERVARLVRRDLNWRHSAGNVYHGTHQFAVGWRLI